MSERIRFTKWALAMAGVSVVLSAVLLFLFRNDAIPLINLWVDVVVGIFTVWGLWWAATEFAESVVKPAVRLLPGNANNPLMNEYYDPIPGSLSGVRAYSLVKHPPFRVVGWQEMVTGASSSIRTWSYHPHVACGIYLENEAARAARHVRLVLRVRVAPPPSFCEFVHGPYSIKNPRALGEYDSDTDYTTVSAQFAEDLVVYESPVLVGQLLLCWDDDLGVEQLPHNLHLDYDVYTLDGTSHGQAVLTMQWNVYREQQAD